MNPSSQHMEIVQKLAHEGPLTLAQLISVGAVALLIIAFFAWRDYRAAGPRRLLLFLTIPRLIALAVALWMLSGPSAVTVSRQFTPKSIVILADGSCSMNLVDAVDGSGNTLRWSPSQPDPVLAALDRGLGNLCSAQAAVNRIRDAHKTAEESAQAKDLWAQIRQSTTAAGAELGGVKLDPARTDPETAGELGRLGSFLKDGSAHFASAPPSGRRAQDEQLEDLQAFVVGGIRRVERLGQKLSAQFEKLPSSREKAEIASESMLTRKEKVAAWLSAAEDSWLKDLEAKTRVIRYKFAANVLPVADADWRGALAVETNLDSRGTDLGAALAQAAQDSSQQSVDAVVLLTDGGHNTPDDPRNAAAALRGIPVFIVPIGSTVIPRDVVLHHIQCPRAVFKNDNVVLDAMVTAYYCQGEQVRVELSSDGTVVQSQTVPINSPVFDTRVSFSWKASDLGRHKIKVRAVPLPKEHSLANNEAQAEVEVMENTIRVLLADDLPRWEFRYLTMLFKRDKHVEFDQLIFEPNDDAQAAQQTFPTDLAGWQKYRVVILGDVSPEQLTVAQQQNLRKYVVEDGGNLVVIAGETAMPASFAGQPLGEMLPVTSAPIDANQAYSLTVTAEGSVSVPTQLEDDPLASDRIWRDMSTRLPIYNLSPVSKPKPTSHVLISAAADQGSDTRAFLSWQYVGLGRVIYLSAPITYQLRYGIGDLYHHRFWGQLLRWAVAREMSGGSKTVRLLADKNHYEVGDHAQVVLGLSAADGTPVTGAQCGVEALRDNQVVKVIELHEETGMPGLYRGIYSGLAEGQTTLRAVGPTVKSLLAGEGYNQPVEQILNVDYKGTTELSDPVCNLPLLNQIADASGGMLLPPAALQNALAHLNVAPDAEDTELSRTPVWDQWQYLWIIMGCITIEWLARRHWRMV
jgi:hypothetical protein